MELKDIQLPDSMKRAMARQAEAEREKRAKIINAEGESLAAAALGDASDIMMAHPLALQLRNLQSLVEIGVDKNTTVVFPAPLMSTIGELGSFLAREAAAAAATTATRRRAEPHGRLVGPHPDHQRNARRPRRRIPPPLPPYAPPPTAPAPSGAVCARPGRGAGRRGRGSSPVLAGRSSCPAVRSTRGRGRP